MMSVVCYACFSFFFFFFSFVCAYSRNTCNKHSIELANLTWPLSMYLCIYLYIYLSIYLSIYHSIYLFLGPENRRDDLVTIYVCLPQPSVSLERSILAPVRSVTLPSNRSLCLPLIPALLTAPCTIIIARLDGQSRDVFVPLQLPSLHCSQIYTAPDGTLGPVADLDVGGMGLGPDPLPRPCKTPRQLAPESSAAPLGVTGWLNW